MPRINGDQLEWVTWNGDSEQLDTKKRIMEPRGNALTDLSQISAVIVPALRIDQSGYRLGQGGGSYDRALAQISAWRLGLIYSGELTVEPFPVEAHDMKLDAIATPDLIVRFRKN